MAAMASASSRSRLPRRAWPEWNGGVDVLVFRKASDPAAARRRDGLRSVVAVAQISAGDDRRTAETRGQAHLRGAHGQVRSEERRGGEECVRRGIFGCCRFIKKKKRK